MIDFGGSAQILLNNTREERGAVKRHWGFFGASILLALLAFVALASGQRGRELWRLKGGGDIPVPTPILAHGMVLVTNGHGAMSPIFAVRLDATGDISLKAGETSNNAVVWSTPREGGYMITPLVYGDYLYSCKNNGILCCYETGSGKKAYQERLGNGTTGFTASPVSGDGKIYFASEDGDIYLVKAGPSFEVLSKNPMGEICMASPALSEGVIFFRTHAHVVAVADKP
jgi:outer membrane protein assembly factor BamB